ncbi:MAG TPA: DUF2155 domain-containing protein, partial [Acetobacteraceae bacterium]|nr:DUF2155 domain-containing protein [Acetobacteraceae bacterium]
AYQGQPGYQGQPTGQGQPAQPSASPGQPAPAQQSPQGQAPAQAQPTSGNPPVQNQPAENQPGQNQMTPGQPGQAPSAGAAVPGQPPAEGQQPAAPAPPPPNVWLPQGGAVLQALDKVNAITQTLTVKNGQTVTFGSLSITVQACEIRPPDVPQDAAAYLAITDNHPDQPGFKGWTVKSDPSLSMLEHPLYDIRVEGCTP